MVGAQGRGPHRHPNASPPRWESPGLRVEPDRTVAGPRAEAHPMRRAAALGRVGGLLLVAAALPATDVCLAQYDGAGQRPAEHILQVDLLAHHGPVRLRENQVGVQLPQPPDAETGSARRPWAPAPHAHPCSCGSGGCGHRQPGVLGEVVAVARLASQVARQAPQPVALPRQRFHGAVRSARHLESDTPRPLPCWNCCPPRAFHRRGRAPTGHDRDRGRAGARGL
jgi:hypothetical protein